jgi:SAM-dependent methyltransferase
MHDSEKMTSRELGLVLAQQLLDVQDLHFGLWDPALPVSMANFGLAQQRYTDLLLEHLQELLADRTAAQILDIGCGTGHMLEQLVASGYAADAVNPSHYLNRQVKARFSRLAGASPALFESTFEDMPHANCQGRYDLLLCSESFQYIPMPAFFEKAPGLLRSGGYVVICDFFKTDAHGDGAEGDRSFSGGHLLAQFYGLLHDSPFRKLLDEDLTPRISPNIDLLDEWLMQRLAPAAASVDRYLHDQYPRSRNVLKWLARRKLAKLKYKYLSGHRNADMFRKYKTYRLLVLQLAPWSSTGPLVPGRPADDKYGCI